MYKLSKLCTDLIFEGDDGDDWAVFTDASHGAAKLLGAVLIIVF